MNNIDVILIQDDPKLGKRGEIVKVSSGFANNFLIPNHKAKLATPANLKSFQAEKERQQKEAAQNLAKARQLADKVKQTSLTVEVLTGEDEKLYGAVTTHEILRELATKSISVEKKDIHLEEPIRKLGAYEVVIKLHPEVSTKLKVWVVKKKN